MFFTNSPPYNSPSSSKDITSFGFASVTASGTITGTAINVRVPYGTPLTGLVASFTTTGASVKVGSTTQVSGSTANDFTGTVSYTVTAEDGSTKAYSVVVFGPLSARTYLSSPSVATSSLLVTSGELTLPWPVTNPFQGYGPIVFIGGQAPTNMATGTVYYATGSGTSTIETFALADSYHYTFTANSQAGSATIYQVN